MKEKIFPAILIFIITAFVYFGVGSRWTFKSPLDLDHFNPLASAFLKGRLDIPNPATTYDLSFYQGKWYPYWGPLPALLLIPMQIIMGRFIPLFYLNVFIGALNVIVVYFLLLRLKNEFLPKLSEGGVILATLFFAFGTTHFYLSVNCGIWHTAQIVSFFPSALAAWLIFKKKRRLVDYWFSSFLVSLSLFGRGSMIGLLAIPSLLSFSEKKKKKQALLAIVCPFLFLLLLYFLYNWIRFDNPLESGYRYAKINPYFDQFIEKYGIYSLYHLPRNLWQMVFYLPRLVFNNGFKLRFDLAGNSIFYFSPALLAVFLAKPSDLYKKALWLSLLVVMLPILMIYSSGWMQLGYRYSLDFMVPLLLLTVFGWQGNLNFLFFLTTFWSAWVYWLGINALQ